MITCILHFNFVEAMYLPMPQENYKDIGISSRRKLKDDIILIVSTSFQNVKRWIWTFILLCIFWTVWKERNILTFKGGSLAIQKLKNSFVCNSWSWARVYMGEESSSLLGFLEWLAIP